MRKQGADKMLRLVLALGAIFSLCFMAQVSAQQMSSANYSVDEGSFSSGSSLEQCTANYCAKSTAGDLTIGSSSSTNYAAQFGSNTSPDPLLEVSTSQSSTDAGVLSTSTTGKVSGMVKVRSYNSNGYVMQITGTPPSTSGRPLTAMSTTAASSPGTEQFGVNLVSNTTPIIGADPVQVPDGTFSFGSVATGYATTNQFKYINGDIVAQSTKGSGETDYTISMILNISAVTPGGAYKGSFSAVVVPLY